MRRSILVVTTVAAASLVIGASARAQSPDKNIIEWGLDAGAVFGLGDESTIDIVLPASRLRVGFFLDNRWSIEPALGLSYNKVEGSDGIFRYNLELGLLYHFVPFIGTKPEGGREFSRSTSTYARPFVNFTGFNNGGDDAEFSIGAGLGIRVPMREAFQFRFEANLGYGFDNEVARLGLLAGVSFFP